MKNRTLSNKMMLNLCFRFSFIHTGNTKKSNVAIILILIKVKNRTKKREGETAIKSVLCVYDD